MLNHELTSTEVLLLTLPGEDIFLLRERRPNADSYRSKHGQMDTIQFLR